MSLDFQFQVFVLFTFVHLTCYLGSLQWIWASLQLVQLDFYGVLLLPCRHLFVRYLLKFILTFLYQKELEWSISVYTLHKNWSFPLRISSVNVIKSAGNCWFGHIYWRNPWWKTSFFEQIESRLIHHAPCSLQSLFKSLAKLIKTIKLIRYSGHQISSLEKGSVSFKGFYGLHSITKVSHMWF